jgi:hypothetical protein
MLAIVIGDCTLHGLFVWEQSRLLPFEVFKTVEVLKGQLVRGRGAELFSQEPGYGPVFCFAWY